VKLTIDEKLCQGHGLCYGADPDLFGADDQGHGIVIGEVTDDATRARAEKVVQICPEMAISLTDE
jgi:ferredoxin